MKLSDFSRESRIVDLERRELREKLLKEATLTLDFANNTYEVYEGPVDGLTQRPFKDVVDFSRASEATANTATGKVQTVGVDDQRLVGNREGLLIEEQRTNLLLWSEDLTQWNNAGNEVSVTTGITDPEGGSTAFRLEGVSGACRLTDILNTSPVIGDTYHVSLWVRSDNNTKGRIFWGGSVYNFDLTPVWTEVKIPTTTTAESTAFQIRLDPVGKVFDVWHPQLEGGSFSTSYIPTSGSQVTRAADNCSRTLGAECDPLAGTLLVDHSNNTSSLFSRLMSLSNSAGNGGIRFQVNAGGNWIARIDTLNTVRALASSNVQGGSGRIKMALSYTSSSLSLAINGVSFGVVANSDLPLPTKLSIASTSTNSSITSGPVKFACYIPRALSEAELIALTTPDNQ